MAKQELRCNHFTSWFLAEIIRPYQSELTGVRYGDPGYLRLKLQHVGVYYDELLVMAEMKPEWWSMVSSRLSEIYSVIDQEFIPKGQQRDFILTELQKKGVKIAGYAPRGSGEPKLFHR